MVELMEGIETKVKSYFEDRVWDELSEIQKTRYITIFNNYVQLMEMGIPFPEPDFMNNGKPEGKQNENKSRKSKKKLIHKPQEQNGEGAYVSSSSVSPNSKEHQQMIKCKKSIQKRNKLYRNCTKPTEDPDFEIKSPALPKELERARYPKRQRAPVNYEEPDAPTEDRFVYCDFCEESNPDYCRKCGLLPLLKDTNVTMGVANRARLTLPATYMEIRPSPIHGFGVFAKQTLRQGWKMGPYEGKISKKESEMGYSWKLRNGQLVDAADETQSNWMRFVNCARHIDEQNLVAFQYKSGLYYRVFKEIQVGEELLVFYGESFAEQLKIDTRKFFEPLTEKVEDYNGDFCTFCNLMFKNGDNCAIHIVKCRYNPRNKIHIPEKLFKCKYCQGTVTNEAFLNKHEKRCEFGDSKKIKARRETSKRIENANDLNTVNTSKGGRKENVKERSVREDGTNIFWVCGICSKVAKNKSQLVYHSCVHYRDKTTAEYVCAFCSIIFKNVDDLFEHINLRHYKCTLFKCTKCRYFAINKSRLDYHFDDTHRNIQYTCKYCIFTTVYRTNLDKHVEEKHIKTKMFKCNYCSYITTKKGNLKGHINGIHTKNIIYNCTYCSYTTSHSVATLKAHISNKHTKSTMFKCNHCSYITGRKGDLKRHINMIHTKNIIYNCTYCSYTTSHSVATLKAHINNKHTKSTMFKCNHCSYITGRKGDLKRHINGIHTKNIIYNCTYCSYTTSHSVATLKAHINNKHSKCKTFTRNDCND